LFERSTIMLARFRQRLPQSLPLIGIGGVENTETAWAKLEAGASLVQLYSCMIYQGPMIAQSICKGIVAKMAAESLTSLSQITGRKCDEWAQKEIMK
jgi:dihydroorotate dehydrogenase